jgi:hypothetical protein
VREQNRWLADRPEPMVGLFNRYNAFARRFNVRFFRQNSSSPVEWMVCESAGWKFRLTVKDGQLLPLSAGPDDTLTDAEEPTLEVPEVVQQLIDKRKANYVEISDWEGSSAFTTVERLAYLDDGVTIIMRRSNPPYLYCLIGQTMLIEVLEHIGSGITALKRKHFGTGKGGRHRDLELEKGFSEARKRGGPKKGQAFEANPKVKQGKTKIQSAQSFVPRAAKRDAERAQQREHNKTAFRNELLAAKSRND